MPNYAGIIRDLVTGDDYSVIRTITGIPVGDSLAQAWLTIKAAEVDADPGVLQLVVTPTISAGGQIVDTGSGDQTGSLAFTLTAAQTKTLTPGTKYFYDIQIKTTGGKTKTIEKGRLRPLGEVTRATG